MPVRALFDTNIFVSYLLPSRRQREFNTVVEAAIAGTFTLLIPRELVKDDYLLAYALVGSADYLATGDDDLPDLGEVEGVRIVSPSDFAEALRQTS